MDPAVSILMPVYNGERYLTDAIESLLNQSFTDYELIIINDGSTDSSKDIIRSYQNNRIKYIENEKNIGIVATLNKGIDFCNGKYIARMDADDICNPERLKQQVRFMEKHPKIGVCGSWVNIINSYGNTIGKIVNQTKPELVRINLLFSVPLIHPSTLIRTNLLKQNRYRQMTGTEDYDLWCRLAEQTDIVNLPAYLLQYRWHESNVSKKNNAADSFGKQITINELKKLGLTPCDEEYRLHRLSFTLYAFQNDKRHNLHTEDLDATGVWFKKLLDANKITNRFDQKHLLAYLWSRWMVLCVAFKRKRRIFTPTFASYNPKVLLEVFRQARLLSKKK